MDRRPPSGESAIDILRNRYARGEISRSEFEQIRKDIDEGHGKGARAERRTSSRLLVVGTSVVISALLMLALASSIVWGDGPDPVPFFGPGGMMGGGMGGMGG